MRYLVIFIASLMSVVVEAQIVTDRPDQTESAEVIPSGGLQIESGILASFEGEQELYSQNWLLPTNLFRFGLAEFIELRLLSQLENVSRESKDVTGMSDLEIGFKLSLFNDEESITKLALLSHLIVPTGSEAFSLSSYGVINKLCISHALSDKIGLSYNLGYDYLGASPGNLTYSVALGISVSDRVGVYLEPYGNFAEMDSYESSFDAGVTYLLSANTQLDFSFGTGLNYPMNYISVGISALFNSSKE